MNASTREPRAPLFIVQHSGISDARRQHQQALLARKVALPLSARVSWLEAFPTTQSTLFVALDASREPVGAAAVEESPSRALPGHVIWRVRQLDPTASLDNTLTLARAIVAAARNNRRVLRLNFDIFSKGEGARAALVARLPALGLTRLSEPREHTPTLALGLERGTEAIWGSADFATVRRKVRAIKKGGLSVRVIESRSYVPRMRQLLKETYARTGGDLKIEDLDGAIRLSQIDPDGSRIVGTFMSDRDGPDALMSFAWAHRNGAHVVYDTGASTSDPEARKFSLAYAMFWDLIEWASATGADWFDLGGVTLGTKESGDKLSGISDYKRHFSDEVVDVREEWQMEPHPVRAGLANLASAAATTVSRFFVSRRARGEQPVAPARAAEIR